MIQQAKKGLNTMSLQKFIELDIPPCKKIPSPWLTEKSICMIHADRGVGKTYLAMAIMHAVTTGTDLFHWECKSPRKVLYIDGEMPGNQFQHRLKENFSAEDVELYTENAHFINSDFQDQRAMPDISTYSGQTDLAPYLEGFDVIIVDNISTLCRSGVENDAESWGPVQSWALGQRAAGRSVIFIHHTGKNGSQRGTSKKEDIMDAVISLERPPGYTGDQGARFTVKFTKNRGFAGEAAREFIATLTFDENGKAVWKSDLIESRSDKIKALNQEGLNQKDIAEKMGCSPATVSRELKK